MEGVYVYRNAGENRDRVTDALKREKNKVRICSLSINPDDTLMWSHYARGHRGVMIGLQVNPQHYDIRKVEYDGPLALDGMNLNMVHAIGAREILSHKTEVWNYENEVRVFNTRGYFVDAKVELVVCGRSMASQEVGMMKRVVKRLNPKIHFLSSPEGFDFVKQEEYQYA